MTVHGVNNLVCASGLLVLVMVDMVCANHDVRMHSNNSSPSDGQVKYNAPRHEPAMPGGDSDDRQSQA